jgi:hypothetical protein
MMAPARFNIGDSAAAIARDIDAVLCAFSRFGMVHRRGELSPAAVDRGCRTESRYPPRYR